ncbi:hypothetical protein SAMN05216579_1609 [Pseudomonas granadensis]|nr:hypothetical protein SAMN05216579_1609 [Pseudomonas granadensis]
MPGVFGCLVFEEYISVAAVTASYGFALTATHFFSNAKKSKQKTLAPTYGPRKLGSLRSGIDPGAAATVCFAAPPSAVSGCARRSLRSHAWINPSAQPSDVAGESKARSRARELTLIVEWLEAGGWLWICGGAAPHPSPLPREREPIFVLFRICVRLGIQAGVALASTTVSPLSLRERARVRGF